MKHRLTLNTHAKVETQRPVVLTRKDLNGDPVVEYGPEEQWFILGLMRIHLPPGAPKFTDGSVKLIIEQEIPDPCPDPSSASPALAVPANPPPHSPSTD